MSSSLRSEIYILSVLLQIPLILVIEVVFPSPQLWHHTSRFTSLSSLFRCSCRRSPTSSPQQPSAQHVLNLQEQNWEMWTAWRSAHDWGEEEELEAPTTTIITIGGAHPQVLGRTVALTTSTTITRSELLENPEKSPRTIPSSSLVTDNTYKGKSWLYLTLDWRIYLGKDYLALWGSPNSK